MVLQLFLGINENFNYISNELSNYCHDSWPWAGSVSSYLEVLLTSGNVIDIRPWFLVGIIGSPNLPYQTSDVNRIFPTNFKHPSSISKNKLLPQYGEKDALYGTVMNKISTNRKRITKVINKIAWERKRERWLWCEIKLCCKDVFELLVLAIYQCIQNYLTGIFDRIIEPEPPVVPLSFSYRTSSSFFVPLVPLY